MKVSDNSGSSLLAPASLRAQGARKSAGQIDAASTGQVPAPAVNANVSETPASGKDLPANGNALPAGKAASQSAQSSENAKGSSKLA